MSRDFGPYFSLKTLNLGPLINRLKQFSQIILIFSNILNSKDRNSPVRVVINFSFRCLFSNNETILIGYVNTPKNLISPDCSFRVSYLPSKFTYFVRVVFADIKISRISSRNRTILLHWLYLFIRGLAMF